MVKNVTRVFLKEFLVDHFSEVKSLGKWVVFKSFMKKKKKDVWFYLESPSQTESKFGELF